MKQLMLPLRTEVDIARQFARDLVDAMPDDALLTWIQQDALTKLARRRGLPAPAVQPPPHHSAPQFSPTHLRLVRPA